MMVLRAKISRCGYLPVFASLRRGSLRHNGRTVGIIRSVQETGLPSRSPAGRRLEARAGIEQTRKIRLE
jgi:hypothetical protein